MSHAPRPKRGLLRVYLGAAPGVGKTFAMLDEGWRRHERGADVVVGFVETHRRPRTQAQLRDLEVMPRQRFDYRGTVLEEMDVDAILARRPAVALVDELAHTNVPGQPTREALAGRRRAAGRRHRRDHHGQHPAPREPERRDRADHGHPPARDGSGRRRAAGRPDRAGRHEPGGAAPSDGPREHLPGRARRRCARQLLPSRQPGRAPRARPAVGGGQGRGEPPDLHGGARHRGAVGDARARPRRGDGRTRRRAGRPQSGTHRRAPPRRVGRCPRGVIGRAGARAPDPPWPSSGSCWRSSGAATARSSPTRSRRPSWTSPCPRRPRRW